MKIYGFHRPGNLYTLWIDIMGVSISLELQADRPQLTVDSTTGLRSQKSLDSERKLASNLC